MVLRINRYRLDEIQKIRVRKKGDRTHEFATETRLTAKQTPELDPRFLLVFNEFLEKLNYLKTFDSIEVELDFEEE